MSLFDRFRRVKGSESSQVDKLAATPDGFDPEAHRKVLAYLKRLWEGKARDLQFEQTALRALEFNSLSLAELIFAVSNERQIPMERIVHFLRIGIPGGGDDKIATLLERIVILAKQFDESSRIALLSSGVVGNRNEIAPIAEEFNTVGHMVKYCRVIESLKDLKDHDAIDAEYGFVDDDPGWK